MLLRLLLLVVWFAATPAFLHAQNDDDDEDDEEEGTSAPAAAANRGNPSSSGDEDSARAFYPNQPVTEIFTYYENLTGRRLIVDQTAQQGTLTINTPTLKKEDVIRVIESTLLLNGYTLVPSDGNITKVLGPGRPAKSAGIPIISKVGDIPEGEQVITYLFKLRYADPNELLQTLQAYLGNAGNTYTSFAALPKSGALLVTESSTVIRSLFRILQEIDIPPADVVSEFLPLERADAKDVVDKLNLIFEKTPTAGATGAPGTPGQPGARNVKVVNPDPDADDDDSDSPTAANGASAAGPTEDAIVVGKIKLTADIRTNRIHVVTRPENLPFVRKLVADFDSNVKFAEPETLPLKFVAAGDIFPVLVKAITDPGAKPEDAGAAGPNGGANANGQNQSNGTGGSSGFGTNGGSSGTSGTGSSFNVEEGLSTQQAETTPLATAIGSTRIIGDRRANAIIVLGSTEIREKIFKVVRQLDVRPAQVMLNTVIGELTLNDGENFGVDYVLRSGNVNRTPGDTTGAGGTTIPIFGIDGSTGRPVLNTNNLINANTLNQAAAIGSGGLTGYIAATANLDIIVNALTSTGRFQVTQRPSVFTTNNKKAIIASGQQIAVPTQTLSSLNNTGNDNAAVSSSIQYKDVFLQLEVIPIINSDREVSLDVLQKVDELGESTNVGGNEIPTINSRLIKTNVLLSNGATVVLGGLIRKSDRKTVSGVPYLSRVPVLGALFRSKVLTKARTELVVLIRPCVVTKPEEAVTTKEHELSRLKVPPDPEFVPEPDCSPTPYPAMVKTRAGLGK